jgi:hypothetical protein
MPEERLPYVKPLVQQLHHLVDQHVSLAAGCKTTGAASGAATHNCKTQRNTPCVTFGS